MARLVSKLAGIAALLLCLVSVPVTAHAARTDGLWDYLQGGNYIQPNASAGGVNLLLVGSNHYINFGVVTGVNGYGIRDNAGSIECKNSGGSWASCTGGGGGGSGTVTSVDVSGGSTGLTTSGGPVTVSGTITIGGLLNVAFGGTGSTTLSGLLKGNGTSGVQTAVPNTDYQVPVTLTTTGSSGAATFNGTTLNIPQYAGTTYTGTYPVQVIGSAISLAFGTTTSNTWGGVQTFTNSPIFSTLGAGTVNATAGGTIYSTATSSVSSGTGISFAGTPGALIGGTALTITNTGVTSAVAGTGISVSGATGAVTFGNTGLLSLQQLGGGTAQTGAITFSTSTDAFNGLNFNETITNIGGAFTFANNVTGTLGNAGLTNSTISGVALGGTLNSLSATNGTLTFSGSYTGAANQTVGLNLNNPNSWTALQQFTNASSTLFSSTYASSTQAFFGTLTIPSLGTAAGAFLAVDPTGKVIATTTPSGGTGTNYFTLTGSQLQNNTGTSLGLNTAPNLGTFEVQASSSTAAPFAFWNSVGAPLLYDSSTGHLTIGSTTNNNGGLNLIDTNSSLGVGLDSIVLGGNPGGDTDFWMGRYVVNDSVDNDLFEWGKGLVPGTSPFLTLNSIGNFGIGTTSPYAPLSVVGAGGVVADHYIATSTTNQSYIVGGLTVGDATLSRNTYQLVSIGTNNTTGIGDLGIMGDVNLGTTNNNTIGFQHGQMASGGVVQTTAGWDFRGDSHTSGAQSTSIVFSTRNAGSYGARLTINFNGNIGVATTTPFGLFSVGQSTEANSVWIGHQGSSTPSFVIKGMNGNGNVGIGTTSPWRTFSVVGNQSWTGLTAASGGNAVCIGATNDIENAGTQACTISSVRFKQNVQPLSGTTALSILKDIDGYSYDYKTGYYSPEDSPKGYGPIAEYVAKTHPELVDYKYDGTPGDIFWNKLTGLNTDAIDQIQIEIEKLQAEKIVRSMEENYQWGAIILLVLWNLYLTFRKEKWTPIVK